MSLAGAATPFSPCRPLQRCESRHQGRLSTPDARCGGRTVPAVSVLPHRPLPGLFLRRALAFFPPPPPPLRGYPPHPPRHFATPDPAAVINGDWINVKMR